MNKIIRFSKNKLSIQFNIIITTLIITSAILFIFMKSNRELIFSLYSIFLLIFAIILSYKIRYYPLIFVFSDDFISIEYLSKSLFKQKSFNGNINDISIERVKDKIILYNQKDIISEIEKSSISKEDEEFIFSTFKTKL